MITDYKGVDLSLKKKKIKIIRIILVLIILSIIYFYFSNSVDKNKIIRIQELLLQNKNQEALFIFNKISNSLYHKTSKTILEGLFILFDQNYSEAITFFKNTDYKGSIIEHKKFLNYFIEKFKYRELKIYLNFIDNEYEDYYFYKAVLSSAMYKYGESETFIKGLSPKTKKIFHNKLLKIKNTNKQLKTKKLKYIFDINGAPLAYYDLESDKSYPVKDFKGFYFDDFSNTIKNGIRFYTLTLNKNIQNKIHKIFNKYKLNGSFILLKAYDNSIVAAYSKNDHKQNSVFSKTYEPGSIVKLLTMYGYFKYDLKSIFPYDCKSLNIDNNTFYDWISHGTVNSYEQALAWSCNIGFAKIGIQLGLERLTGIYSTYLFNKNKINDLFIKFRMGTFFHNNISNDYELAKTSVGLSVFNKNSKKNTVELINITTIHSALIASIIANKGIINSPFLIKNIKNLTGIGSYNHKKNEIQNFNSPIIFNKIRSSMIKVITDKNGTGKNSYVKFVNVALKTGTAGMSKPYNAILTGFFPSNRPEYIFAFILEKSGPSKNKGARFLKDFLINFYNKGS